MCLFHLPRDSLLGLCAFPQGEYHLERSMCLSRVEGEIVVDLDVMRGFPIVCVHSIVLQHCHQDTFHHHHGDVFPHTGAWTAAKWLKVTVWYLETQNW